VSDWLIAAAAIALFPIALLGVLSGAPAPLRTVLSAPVYYLLPTGVGLLLTGGLSAPFTRTHRLLLAYFVGLITIAAVLVARERWVSDRLPLDPIAAALLIAALVGLTAERRVLRCDAYARRAGVEFLIVLPVFCFGYLFRFGVLSDYPLVDLFQATHLMKGALEFARFDIINPFTADSYVPVIPVVEGLLVRYLGFAPLPGVWVLPVVSFPLAYLALRAAVQPLMRARSARVLTVAIVAAFLSPFAPTNGDLASFGSLALLSLVATGAAGGTMRSALLVGATTIGALIAGLLAARQPPLVYLLLLLGVCVLLRFVRGRRVAIVVASAVLVISIAPIHRSVMAFVPAALLCGLFLPIVRRAITDSPRYLQGFRAAAVIATGVVAVSVTGILAVVWTHPGAPMQFFPVSGLINLLLGTSPQNADTLKGAGPKVALFELARSMSPSFVVLVFAGAVLAWQAARRAAKAGDDPAVTLSPQAMLFRAVVPQWTLAMLLLITMLAGVPFVYRAAFFVHLLLAGVFATLYVGGDATPLRPREVMWALAFAVAYVALVSPILYHCLPLGSCHYAPYVRYASGFFIIGGACLAAGGVTLCLIRRLNERHWRFVSLGLIVGLFAWEFRLNNAYFMPYSYGPEIPAGTRALSHLSKPEIDLARVLRASRGQIVLVSDAFTLANLRALTGLNSVVSFSNLDTMPATSKRALRLWLRDVLTGSGASGDQACYPFPPLDLLSKLHAFAPELNYAMKRWFDPTASGSKVLSLFGYRPSLVLAPQNQAPAEAPAIPSPQDQVWVPQAVRAGGAHVSAASFMVVIDRKTVRWARDSADWPMKYYPSDGLLSSQVLASLERRCNATVFNDRFALLRIPFDAH
jgi:hypothetical protein